MTGKMSQLDFQTQKFIKTNEVIIDEVKVITS